MNNRVFLTFSQILLEKPSNLTVSIRVKKLSYYQSLQMNYLLQFNNVEIARNNEYNCNFNKQQKITLMPLTLAQNMLLLHAPFLVFVLCFLALATVSLFKLEKIIRFKYYHTVLKVVLEGLEFFHLYAV